jgi:four helix bundle protein
MVLDFKNLEIWIEARSLSLSVYSAAQNFPKEELFGLTNQLQRAAVSVAANIAESCGRFGVKEKAQLLIIARESVFEVRSHISIAAGLGYLTNVELNSLDSRYEILTRRINAYIAHVKTLKPKSSV